MDMTLTELKQICSEGCQDISAFAESRIGGRSENQDSYGWADTKFGYLVTVCDGMGGGPGGKTASSIAVQQIIAGVEDGLDDQTPGAAIVKAIQRANMAIIEAAEEQPELKGMGSTATVLLINGRSAWAAHVGDSRIYQLRGGKKVFRTFDHSMVFDMVKKGVITEEQARLSAQSNIITRALGVKSSVDVDLVELPYLAGDRFVLTTDGIHGTMPEPELIKKCFQHSSPGAVVDAITTEVDNTGHLAGNGHDNLTIAIVKTKNSSKLKPKMTNQVKIIMVCLACLCLISIGINIKQSINGSPTDFTEEISKLQDSIKNLNDTISLNKLSIKCLNKQIESAKHNANNN